MTRRTDPNARGPNPTGAVVVVLAVLVVASFSYRVPVRAQGLGGGMPGGGTTPGARGSAVSSEGGGGSNDEPEPFGGLQGGEGRRGGTAGSAARGLLRGTPGDPG